MSKPKPARAEPKIAGRHVPGTADLRPSPGNSVFKHQGKYHVFVGLKKTLVTTDMTEALTEASKATA